MQSVAINSKGPKAFILSSDGEFSHFDPENDQVWSLNLEAADNYPFSLQTTYHLQAKSMRLFPNIIVDHQRLTQKEDFTLLPTVTSYTPGTIQVKYCCEHPLTIQFTCFLPEADVLVGSIKIENSGSEPVNVSCEMGALLAPMGKGSPIHPTKHGNNQVLTGKTEDIFPVLMMSNGPTATSNPYPALSVPLEINPDQSKILHWALASKKGLEQSLAAVHEVIASDWQAAYHNQIKAQDKKRITIKTGEPEWDSAFSLAQVNALTHLATLDSKRKEPVFVRSRLPDSPIAIKPGDKPVDDLTLLDIHHLTQVILPTYTKELSQLIERYSTRVDPHGCLPSHIVHWHSGKPINECPLLANLCLMLYETNQDREFLSRVFPHLERFFTLGWFNNDNPGKGTMPHWETPAQLQLEMGLFGYDMEQSSGKGLDIRTAESPALSAMLYREAAALQKIAQILGNRSARLFYNKTAKWINESMMSQWDETQFMFTYRDHQSHLSPEREIYLPGLIKSEIDINKTFTNPQRLHIQLTAGDEHSRACEVRITGHDQNGETIVEQYQSSDLHWIMGQAHITTSNPFSTLDKVAFQDFNAKDRFLIETADYSQTDISCLLPIWTGQINKDMISKLIENQFDLSSPAFSSGIPETWHHLPNPPDHSEITEVRSIGIPEGLVSTVNILWNTLIIDGLVREGFLEIAVEIFTNLMSTIIHGLKDYNGFYPAYQIENGVPIGQPNTITGLAPVGLLLKIAGIKLLSPHQVAVWGHNPFPWPLEVRWQGLWVRKESEQTNIIFPDGTQYQSQSTKPVVVNSTIG